MTRRVAWMSRRSVAVVLLALAAPLPASAAAQSASQRGADKRLWYQAYSDGTAAIQRKDWQAAVDSLEAAKRAHPAVGRRVAFYGDIVRPFDPDYYLGIAYLNLKRFADADAAFQRVRDAKLIVSGDPEYSVFDKDATAAVFEHQMANAEEALKGKDYGKAQQAAVIARNTGVDSARVDDLTRRISSAQTIVQAAPGVGTTGTTSPANPTPGPVIVPPVGGQSSPQDDLARRISGAQGIVERSNQAVVQTDRVGEQSSSPRPSLTQAIASSAGAASAAIKTPPVGPRPQPRGPATPGDEQTAIETFLSGDYEAASRLLTAIAQRTPSPRTHFYLACSNAALVLTGKANQSLLNAARAELAQAVPLTQFVADQRFVSPRILQALEAAR